MHRNAHGNLKTWTSRCGYFDRLIYLHKTASQLYQIDLQHFKKHVIEVLNMRKRKSMESCHVFEVSHLLFMHLYIRSSACVLGLRVWNSHYITTKQPLFCFIILFGEKNNFFHNKGVNYFLGTKIQNSMSAPRLHANHQLHYRCILLKLEWVWHHAQVNSIPVNIIR